MHFFMSCNTIPQLVNSDHFGLHIRFNHTPNITQDAPQVRRKIWRYKHANFDEANNLLMDIDLDGIIDPNNIQSTWSNWKKSFLDIMD